MHLLFTSLIIIFADVPVTVMKCRTHSFPVPVTSLYCTASTANCRDSRKKYQNILSRQPIGLWPLRSPDRFTSNKGQCHTNSHFTISVSAGLPRCLHLVTHVGRRVKQPLTKASKCNPITQIQIHRYHYHVTCGWLVLQ